MVKNRSSRTASDETLALARAYLEAHRVAEGDFGLGPFLQRGHRFELRTTADTRLTGSFEMRFHDGYLDCRTISEGMYRDIKKNNPELRPRIADYHDHGAHNWVEITDPRSGAMVQIDATPWFNRLDPGHVGGEAYSEERISRMVFSEDRDLPFTIKTTHIGQVSVYLIGSMPGSCLKKSREGGAPEFRFILLAVDSGFDEMPKDYFSVYADVHDAHALRESLARGMRLEEMSRQSILATGFHFPGESDISVPLDRVERFSKRLNTPPELWLEIKRALPMMIPLLRMCDPGSMAFRHDTDAMLSKMIDRSFLEELKGIERKAFRRRKPDPDRPQRMRLRT
ncbi:MAG: hypothetical protein V1827_03465 [Candidatus Micrarchaeota archaeon]